MTMDEVYEQSGPDIHSGKLRHKVIADLVEGPRVLDFGCGAGDLLLLLQEARPEWGLAGVDISEVALDFAKERGFTGDVSNSVNGHSGYDTVVASQVLEHVDRPVLVVRSLERALAPGGLLIVSVPNGEQVKSPDHKRVYEIESLRWLLEHVGKPALHSWSGEATRILMTVRKGEGGT